MRYALIAALVLASCATEPEYEPLTVALEVAADGLESVDHDDTGAVYLCPISITLAATGGAPDDYADIVDGSVQIGAVAQLVPLAQWGSWFQGTRVMAGRKLEARDLVALSRTAPYDLVLDITLESNDGATIYTTSALTCHRDKT